MENNSTNKYNLLGLNSDWGRPGCDGKYGGVGWYRIINPLEKIGADVQRGTFQIGIFPNGAQSALDLKARGDIWVTKPMDSMDVVRELLVAKEFTGAKLVLDLDDDPFNLNEDHPSYKDFIKKRPQYEAFIKGADRLIVSSEHIKNVVKDLNDKITVIPNAIDPEIWKVKRKKRTDGKIKIGWFGSASHMTDMPIILPVIEQIEKKYPNVEFHLAGMVTEDIKEGRRFHHSPTKGYEEYPQWVADMDLDIAIAPLKDTQFNRCKTNIKWLEHSMLKTPMVLSNVTPYKESVKNYKTGYLAEGTAQWVKYLSWLIESPEKRKEIGENAYNAVLKDWLIEKQLPKYEKLFNSMQKHDITVYTSVIGGFDDLTDSPKQGNANYIAYTYKESELWEVRKPSTVMKDNRRNSRIQKIMPHMFFDTEYTIYMDGNIELMVDPRIIIDEFLKEKDIAVFRHIGRDCVYDEADACLSMGKGKREELAEQIKAYAKKGHPRHGGLAECGFIVRRNTPRIEALNEQWWAHYCRYSERDQLSFPVVFNKEEVNFVESSCWRHPYVKYHQHK